MILAYRILSNFLYPFLFIFLYLRVFLKKEDPKRFKEKLFTSHFNVKRKDELKLIWFHAASIGEFKSIVPLIEQLNTNKKSYEFLITTSTLSSGNLAKSELKNLYNVHHRYFPFDVSFLIDKFLQLWRPEKIFLVDSEIWPNLILKSKARKIPLAIINARLTEKSFNRWSIFPKTAEKIFSVFDLCLCSNKETQNYLGKLRARNVRYEGNLKLIKKININKINEKNSDILSKIRFWFAASIHEEEDIFCLKIHNELKKSYKDIITIIAPRHLNTVEKIKILSEKKNFKVQILNRDDKISEDKEILIVNSFGFLQSYFKYAKSVFIGKSIVPRLKHDSGQSPIDAAKLNCKIYHGPYVSNFKELYEIFKINKISHKIDNYLELSKKLILDLKENQKKERFDVNYIRKMEIDILINTMNVVNNFLQDENK